MELEKRNRAETGRKFRFALAAPAADGINPRMFPDFRPPFSAEVQQEALSYQLTDDFPQELPEGLPDDRLERLYYLAQEGHPLAVPELKKAIARHPDFPPLRNFLSSTYRAQGRMRQAREVERELFERNPDYLFARIAEADHLISRGQHDEARAMLGGTLRLRDVSPDEPAHPSQWIGFYNIVGHFYVATGQVEEAQAILNALRQTHGPTKVAISLQGAILQKRAEVLRDRIKADEKVAIRIIPPPIPRQGKPVPAPEPVHGEIAELFEYGDDFPEELHNEILALPRATAVADLVMLLDHAVANGPYLFHAGIDGGETWYPLHALLLLGEMRAGKGLAPALRFLEQHPDLINFWFGDLIDWQAVYHLVGTDLDVAAAWMIRPGLNATSRRIVADAVSHIAVKEPERRAEAIEWFRGAFRFLLESPPADRVLDTELVSRIVWAAVFMRAVELVPEITEAYAKNYVSKFMVGTLESVVADMSKPPKPEDLEPLPGMMKFYRKIMATQTDVPKPAFAPDDYHDFLGQPEAPDLPAAGRNDPCPCGSGKKYKKCCL